MLKTIGELAADDEGAIAIGPFGSSMKADLYTASGVPVIRGNNLTGRPGIYGELAFVSEATAARFSRCIVKAGDLVFPHRGAIGEVGLVTGQGYDEWMLSTSMMKLRPHPSKLDSRFAFYFFRSPVGRHQLLRNASQVGTPGIGQPLTTLRACEIMLPPLDEQRAIAAVLGSLDDKIEQNRRIGRALEGLASAVYKAWFVDFEPVRAKAACAAGFPGMPPAAFAALPTRLTDSPLGSVPEGWLVGPLSEMVKLTMGQSPKSEFYNAEGRGMPFHQGVTDYGFRFPTGRVYCTAHGRLAAAGDVLLSVRAPVGRINVADRQLVLGRGLAGLRHRDNQQSFLLYQMRHTFAEEDAIGDGTIYKAVNKNFLSAMPLLAPPPVFRQAFEAFAQPMDELVMAGEVESAKLAALRDYLLPRLLSGRVRWKDIEATPEVQP